MNKVRTQKPHCWPIVAMAAGVFVLGLIARSFFNFPGPDAIEAIPYSGIAAGQVILLGIWSALGRTGIRCRVISTVFGLSLVWLISFYDMLDVWLYRNYMEAAVTFFGLMVPLLTTALTLGAVQAFRWRLNHRSAAPEKAADMLQFSLRHVFVATTVAAVFLMGARGVRSFYTTEHFDDVSATFVFTFILAVGYPLIAVTSVGACLASRYIWLRLGIVALTAGTVTTLPLLIVPFDAVRMVYAASTLIGTLVVLTALWVVRSCGYRLERHHVAPTIAKPPL